LDQELTTSVMNVLTLKPPAVEQGPPPIAMRMIARNSVALDSAP
jgi:hypothetical protein